MASSHVPGPSAPDDLPPPYSAIVGNSQYGFRVPISEELTSGTHDYPPNVVTTIQPGMSEVQALAPGVPSGVVIPPDYTVPTSEALILGTYRCPQPKPFTEPGVYPHPLYVVTTGQPQVGEIQAPPAVGSEPTTVTCFNCGKVVTTKVNYTTSWHTHLVAGSICIVTMYCSICCLGLVPYCFDTFKDAEHYCPNCNTFIGKSKKY